MKRHFLRSLAALFASAAALFAVSSFFVSCEYLDDPLLKGEDPTLTDQMKDLNEKLDSLDNKFDELEDKDKELDDKINQLVNQVYTLEQSLNKEIAALKDLLKGKLFISEVRVSNDTTILVVIDESKPEGMKESVLKFPPQKDLKSVVTYITSMGVDYWAYIDADGRKQYFLNEDGEAIPVIADTPEVIERDGEHFIVIGGVEYPMSGNSVFSDYELITDEITGVVTAVTFSFGEDMSFTVTVDGSCGFYFVMSSGGNMNTVVIDNYFISPGSAENIQIQTIGVVDYVLQIPDGWRVKETEDKYMGTKYLRVTAPSAELIASGIAAAEGELKVVAVLQGGKATVAKLDLSTVAFTEFSLTFEGATVTRGNGLYKYVYGICPAGEYDEEAILPEAEVLLSKNDEGVASYDMKNMPLAELTKEQLVQGKEYVFWALPALYLNDGEDSSFYLKAGTFSKVEFVYSSIKFEISEPTFRDAVLNMAVEGSDAYYMNVVPKADFILEDVLIALNNKSLEAKTDNKNYSGSLFGLAGVKAEPSTEYVAWITLAEDGKEYTDTDVLVREFSTLGLTSGGNVEVLPSDLKATALDVTAKLTAAGAEKIYYVILATTNANRFTTDEARVEYVFKSGKSVEAAELDVKVSDFITKIKAETSYTLFAFASDADGKYGKVLVQVMKTTAIEYNSLTVDAALAVNTPDKLVLKLNTTGGEAVDYLYWIGKTSDNTWKSTNYLGGSAANAQKYMYMNQNSTTFSDVAKKYPVENGEITITDHTPGLQYVIVVMAKDAEGLYSEATELRFTPYSVSIGDIVYADDPKWEPATPVIEFLEETFRPTKGMMYGSYTFKITVPVGFTAYILTASDAYFTQGQADAPELPVDEKILTIIDYTDKSRDDEVCVNDSLWIADGYPYGYEFYRYEHGNPSHGSFVLWGSREFHDSLCDCGGDYESTSLRGDIVVPKHHRIHINNGEPVIVTNSYAFGSKTEVIDVIFVVLQDADGNCYESYRFEVPFELFANAQEE